MQISVNMKHFKERFNWNTDTVRRGEVIDACKGKFFTLDPSQYIEMLTDMNIFFTAR